ncbi:MAG: hypothetical protein E7Z90_06930 [Cyanobacteria bacterium SIG29]|nr:hypothetical protein [Cyanobacteria bacterium SIG29]
MKKNLFLIPILMLLSAVFVQNAYCSELQLDTAKSSAFENNAVIDVSEQKRVIPQSKIEEMFNGNDLEISKTPLMQVGYNLFGAVPTGQATTGKYDNSYKLSVGEKVTVYLQGDSVDVMAISGTTLLNPVSSAEVDSKGQLFIQGLGSVPAEGKTLEEVEKSINKIASKKYKSLKVTLNVSSGQGFSVFVFGQVNKPGKVFIGNNSTVFDALNAAGGVKKSGTLRNIKYQSGDSEKQIVDLYNSIFLGKVDEIIVKPNDKIFVDKIGNVVALKNGVIEPGIYETKEGETVQDVVNYAGGLNPTTQVTEVTLIGFNKLLKQKSAQNIAWEDAKSTVLANGDSVEFRELYNNVENIVTIQGNIKYPATYGYKDGMRLSDILKSEDDLLEETFIHQAVIRRVSGKDNTVETIPVFLKDFFSGLTNPLLQPKDIITVYKNTNSEFVDVYGCINLPKHLTYIEGMTLDDLMTDIQFIESDIKVEEPVKDEPVNTGKKKNNKDDVVLETSTTSYNKMIPAENVAVEITSKDGNTRLYYLYDIMINSGRIKTIKIQPNDKVFFRTLRSNEVLKSVKISGFVKKPGVYTSLEGKKLTDIIQMAGGLSQEADLRGIVYNRASLQGKQIYIARKNNDRDIKLLEGRIASAYKPSEADQKTKMDMIEMLKDEEASLIKRYTGQIALNIKSNDLDKIKDIDNVLVQDGDDIYIPRMNNQVSIMGEVYNEQSFIYKKGASANYYIKQVGGYTPNANKFRLYKVGVNGRAVKIGKHSGVEAGDIIVVPRRIAGNDWLTPVCEALKSIAALVTSAFIVTKI